jgi:hypothetical protein
MKIWSVSRFNNESSIVTPSEEFASPLMAVLEDGDGGKMPLSTAGIQLSRKGLIVTAFGKNPDGDGTVLRLWEEAGDSGQCSIQLPAGHSFTTAQFCDLRGQQIGKPFPIVSGTIAGGKIQMDIGAYQPISIVLK